MYSKGIAIKCFLAVYSIFLFLRRVGSSFTNSFEKFIQSLPNQTPEYLFIKPHTYLFPQKKLTLICCPISKEKDKIYSEIELQIPQDIKTVCIYEDQWFNKESIIKSRIFSLLGLNQTIAGRSCKISLLDKPEADRFFNENHLLGASSYSNKYGLIYKNELVASMAFSKSRVMVDAAVYYRSYELIRFANKKFTTVTGGLNKLLRHFIQEKHAAHIMTYIDLDWGDGASFTKLGFKEIANTEPHCFYIDPISKQRFSVKEMKMANRDPNKYIQVWNRGSKKLILDINKP